MNDEDGGITASDKDRNIILVGDKDGDIAASDKDRDSLMSDTSSSWREIELIWRPSTAVPGEYAPRSQKWFAMVSWTRRRDGRGCRAWNRSVELVDNNALAWGYEKKKVIRA